MDELMKRVQVNQWNWHWLLIDDFVTAVFCLVGLRDEEVDSYYHSNWGWASFEKPPLVNWTNNQRSPTRHFSTLHICVRSINKQKAFGILPKSSKSTWKSTWTCILGIILASYSNSWANWSIKSNSWPLTTLVNQNVGVVGACIAWWKGALPTGLQT